MKKNNNRGVARRSIGDIVVEVVLPAQEANATFEGFIQRHADRIHQIVDEYRLGYVVKILLNNTLSAPFAFDR